MDEHLYQKITAEIRQEILEGKLRPGDRLPTVRQMTGRWDCTVGTVQRAYQELAHQGLVVSRPGQGTHVLKALHQAEENALRRAALVHRSEAFLLEQVTAGYSLPEINTSLQQAMERWQVIAQQAPTSKEHCLRFAGSHDPAIAWLGMHFSEIAPHMQMQLSFSGSLGGLIALAEGKTDLAGCHLWDEEKNTYNEPFVRRLLPGKRVALLTLAHRRLGLITAHGNPLNIHDLADLARPEIRFVNRQSGSGTRVWLDVALHKAGVSTDKISGYTQERQTHSEIAAAINANQADVGFGLETAARSYELEFIYLVRERYDLAIPGDHIELPAIQCLIAWLKSPAAQQVFIRLGGYENEETGLVRWVS